MNKDKVVLKYILNAEICVFNLPKNAKPLTAFRQNRQICMWVEIPKEEKDMELRTFRVFGTGHTIPSNMKWVSTFNDRPHIWHIYEEMAE
jgi:hypothetical protein